MCDKYKFYSLVLRLLLFISERVIWLCLNASSEHTLDIRASRLYGKLKRLSDDCKYFTKED